MFPTKMSLKFAPYLPEKQCKLGTEYGAFLVLWYWFVPNSIISKWRFGTNFEKIIMINSYQLGCIFLHFYIPLKKSGGNKVPDIRINLFALKCTNV
jgi:hypothetical protein